MQSMKRYEFEDLLNKLRGDKKFCFEQGPVNISCQHHDENRKVSNIPDDAKLKELFDMVRSMRIELNEGGPKHDHAIIVERIYNEDDREIWPKDLR